jgi:sialidase-1
MTAKSCICLLALALVGCAGPRYDHTGPFQTMLATASAAHPRHSEGDVVVLKDGTLLAAWSNFSGGGEDHAAAEIVAARSRDGGRNWSNPSTFQTNIGSQNVMSASLLRSHSEDILFFFLRKNSNTDLKVLLRRSADEGQTWSEPVVVTSEPGYHIMNNARAIQLKSGRLLCPVSTCADIGARDFALQNVVYFSDDDGRTWRRGKGTVNCPKRGAMEPGLVELKDGKVLQVVRTQMGQIWFATSADHGDTWSQAEPSGIVAPEAPSTIARMPRTGELLLIYNPGIASGVSTMKSRTPLVCSTSRDEGKTWSVPKVIESNTNFTYAYTSVTFDRNRALFTYYYAPAGISRCSLMFKNVPLDWLRREQ